MLEKLKTAGKIFGFGVTTIVGAAGIGKTIAEIINNKGDDDLVEIDEIEDDDDDLEEEEIEE